jgi:hypothetical protein
MKIKKNDLITYQFENSNEINQARVLKISRKKYKNMDMIKILPLTEFRGICLIPKKCVKQILKNNIKNNNLIIETLINESQ